MKKTVMADLADSFLEERYQHMDENNFLYDELMKNFDPRLWQNHVICS